MRAALRDRRVEAPARRLWPIVQTAAAGAIAWELARALPGHDSPLFAPIVAIVAMGVSAGHRGRDAVVLVLGAALGIAVADVLVRLVGSGAPQIGLVVFVSMALALLFSREPLFVTQAGISALLVVAVERQTEGWAPDRLIDALIGAGVALVMALLLFPLDPMTTVRRAARPVLDDLVSALEAAAGALRTGDLERAEAARAIARGVDERRLLEALGMALGSARRAPRRMHARGKLEPFRSTAPSLDLLVRGVRTVAGASARVVRTRGGPAPELADAVAALARAVAGLRAWLEGDLGASHRTVRQAALEAARAAGAVGPATEIGAGTIAHLVEALAVELLRASTAPRPSARCEIRARDATTVRRSPAYFRRVRRAGVGALDRTPADRVDLEVHRRLLEEHVRAGDRVLEAGAEPGRFTLRTGPRAWHRDVPTRACTAPGRSASDRSPGLAPGR